MSKISLTFCIFMLSSFIVTAQLPNSKQIQSRIKKKVVTAVSNGQTNSSSIDETTRGLKEALVQGVGVSVTKLGAVDGFFRDSLLKILLPPDARKAESRLRQLGLGSEVDRALLAMNRGAETAVSTSAEIFKQAIFKLTIQDAVSILKGNPDAATQFLRRTCMNSLTEKMKPIVRQALNQVEATKYWSDLVKPYNMISKQKINPDLTAYVTEKAMDGLFTLIAKEELRIRKDPVARTTEVLQRVFGSL